MISKTLSMIAALALLFGPSGASAEEEVGDNKNHELNVSLGVFNQQIAHSGYDAFSASDWMPMFSIGLEFEPFDDFFVAASYLHGYSSASIFLDADGTLSHEGWELRVKKGFQLLSWLRPYAAISGTYSWYGVEVVRSSGSTLTQEDGFLSGHFGGRGGLGAEFMVPRKVLADSGIGSVIPGFTFGVAVEAGYALRQLFDMGAVDGSAGYGGVDGIRPSRVDLGEVDLSGWYWSLDFRALF